MDQPSERLTRRDLAAFAAPIRILLFIGNGAILAILAFSGWVLDFKPQSLKETAFPATVLLLVAFNSLVGTWLYLSNRRAKKGRKIIISGEIDRIEEGYADDEVPKKFVHIGRESFEIPAHDLSGAVAGQSIQLHYLVGEGAAQWHLLEVRLDVKN